MRRAGWLGIAALLSGASMAQDISIAQIGPFSVKDVPEAAELRDGARACFEQANRTGGVKGRRIDFFALDDQLDPALFSARLKEAMVKKPLALVVPVSSVVVGHLLKNKLLDTHDVVVVGTVPGAEVFREPGHPRLFHIRAGDKQQLERLLEHSKTLGYKRLHVVSQELAVGKSGLAVVQATAQRMGGLQITSSTASHDAASLQEAVQRAAGESADAYLLVGYPPFMAEALTRLRAAGVKRSILALGYLRPSLAVQAAGTSGARGLGLVQVFPNPNGLGLKVQRDFQSAMQQSSVKQITYTPYHLEGCLAARVVVEGLRRIDGVPTPTALAKALHTMGEVDFGGFRIRFGEGQVGSAWTDIGVVGENGRLMY